MKKPNIKILGGGAVRVPNILHAEILRLFVNSMEGKVLSNFLVSGFWVDSVQ